MQRPLLISISGATCSGKTTLCDMILSEFSKTCTVIHQDDFYLDDSLVPYTSDGRYQLWDSELALDWEKLVDAVQQNIHEHHQLLILEGIMILRNKYILNESNLKYFIDLDYKTCAQRRRSRTDYIDPDDGFFDTVVWPYHCDMMKKVKKIPSVTLMDGHKTLNDLHQIILDDIKKLLILNNNNH